jgi:hypothetical protein
MGGATYMTLKGDEELWVAKQILLYGGYFAGGLLLFVMIMWAYAVYRRNKKEKAKATELFNHNDRKNGHKLGGSHGKF